MRITEDMLREVGACKPALDEFCRRFPDGVTFRDEADAVAQCVAVAGVFPWGWTTYRLIQMPARSTFREEWTAAQDAYNETMAGVTYDYVAVQASARAACDAAIAEAFARAFVSQFDEEGVQE